MLHAPTSRRERILVYGPSNAGKTTNVVDIAQWIKKTRGTSLVHFVDNDQAWAANDPGGLDDVVVVYDVWQWGDYKTAIRKALESSKPDDWLVVDMVGKVYSEAQEAYIDAAYGKDLDEFFLQRLTRNDSQEVTGVDFGGAYGINWQAISKLYNGVFLPLQRARCHLYCGSGARDVRQPDKRGNDQFADKKETRDLFGRIGQRPIGPNQGMDLAHAFHTVLHQQEHPNGRVINTAKDRNREVAKGVVLTPEKGFVVEYLMKTGKWLP